MSATVTYKGNTLTTVNNQTRTLETAGTYLEDDITIVDVTGGGSPTLQTKSVTYTATTTTITDTVTADAGYDGLDEVDVTVNAVPIANFYTTAESGYYTENNKRKWRVRGVTDLDIGEGDSEGWIGQGRYNGDYAVYNAVATGTTVTPSTSSQTIGGANYMMEGPVTVSAIKQAGVGDDGYQSEFYTENNVRKFRSRFWKEYGTGGYVGPFSDNEAVFEYWNTYNAVQSGTTVTPSTSSQSIGGADYMMEGAVTVNAMPSGTEGTPTATKGTVSSNSVTVTPSVINSAGYISGGTHTGTAVTVSASELVSGTKSITSSGTHDVANYANASVAAGSATVPSTASGTGATYTSSGTTLTLTKTLSITPTVSAGYVASGTAGNIALTVSATDANFLDSNIKSGVSIFGKTGTYSGGGGGSSNWELLGTKSLGTISTSSTTDTDTGQTLVLGSSVWNNYDLIVFETSVNTKTNNRHAASVRLAYMTASSAVGTKNGITFATATWNCKLSSSGTATTRSNTTAYGVYAKAGTISGTNLTITIYQRYNSTQTGTINGSYTLRAYGVKLYDLIGG